MEKKTKIFFIVLLVVILALAIFLLNKIFRGGTCCVEDYQNSDLKGQINQMFSENKQNIILYPSSGKVRIEMGTPDFGIALAAKTSDESSSEEERLKYTITLTKEAKDCVEVLGEEEVSNIIDQKLGVMNNFNEYEGSKSYTTISFDIPQDASKCAQKINIEAFDTKTNESLGNVSLQFEII